MTPPRRLLRLVLALILVTLAGTPASAERMFPYSACDEVTVGDDRTELACIATTVVLDVTCWDAAPKIACRADARLEVSGSGSRSGVRGIARSNAVLDLRCRGYTSCGSVSTSGSCRWGPLTEGCAFDMLPSVTILAEPTHYVDGRPCVYAVARLSFLSQSGVDANIATLFPVWVAHDPSLPPSDYEHACLAEG